jgi:hypothetical protein
MTTTTTTFAYRAQTDPTIKTWHLGAAEREHVCFCGVKLLHPGDARKFAAKIPADQRGYETSDDLTRVSCGACKRNREYAKATAAPLDGAAAERDAGQAARPSRRRARTGDPRADRAAAAAADAAAVTPAPRRRQSRADRAHARQEQDRARREALAADADADAAGNAEAGK